MRILAVLALTLSGCSLAPVESWDRDRFLKPEMAWESDALLGDFRRHTYESKEAASGSIAIGGGGCGCK